MDRTIPAPTAFVKSKRQDGLFQFFMDRMSQIHSTIFGKCVPKVPVDTLL